MRATQGPQTFRSFDYAALGTGFVAISAKIECEWDPPMKVPVFPMHEYTDAQIQCYIRMEQGLCVFKTSQTAYAENKEQWMYTATKAHTSDCDFCDERHGLVHGVHLESFVNGEIRFNIGELRPNNWFMDVVGQACYRHYKMLHRDLGTWNRRVDGFTCMSAHFLVEWRKQYIAYLKYRHVLVYVFVPIPGCARLVNEYVNLFLLN